MNLGTTHRPKLEAEIDFTGLGAHFDPALAATITKAVTARVAG